MKAKLDAKRVSCFAKQGLAKCAIRETSRFVSETIILLSTDIFIFYTMRKQNFFTNINAAAKLCRSKLNFASVVSQLVSITFGENLVVSYFVRHIVARGDSWNEGKLRWQTADRSKPPDDNKVGGGP